MPASATSATDDNRVAADALAARADPDAESRKIAIPALRVLPVDADASHAPFGESAVLRARARLRCSGAPESALSGAAAHAHRAQDGRVRKRLVPSHHRCQGHDDGNASSVLVLSGAGRRSCERSSREEASLFDDFDYRANGVTVRKGRAREQPPEISCAGAPAQ